MMSTKVYLVGDDNSPKTNQWLAMTNCPDEAARIMGEIEEACRIKPITVNKKRKVTDN